MSVLPVEPVAPGTEPSERYCQISGITPVSLIVTWVPKSGVPGHKAYQRPMLSFCSRSSSIFAKMLEFPYTIVPKPSFFSSLQKASAMSVSCEAGMVYMSGSSKS